MAGKVDLFRRLACGLPGAMESAHMGHPDFRAFGRIFATLSGQAHERGMVKLTGEQQAEFVADRPDVFEPVAGGWGRMGCTYVRLQAADEDTMRGALKTAYRNAELALESKRKKPKSGSSVQRGAARKRPTIQA